MKVTCIQMDTKLGCPNENFFHAKELIQTAMQENPDVIVLPETWNTGFFPKENLTTICDLDGMRVKQELGGLAGQYGVNLIAGSISNLRGNRVYNTAMVFDRRGTCIASYDKTHLFSPMQENQYYTPGDRFCTFTLDGVSCGLAICYDIRFPELTRSMAVSGTEMLFMVCQWPQERIFHLRSLTTARAIENQVFLVCCNGCGIAEQTVFGGNSVIIDPLGNTLALAGREEAVLSAECDISVVRNVRAAINVFADRRAELYRI